jgi:osmotically-inducible protein OsmY
MTMPINSHGLRAAPPYADQEDAGPDMYARVANALYWHLAIPRNRIDVSVEGDLVTLRGVVERAYEKSCAAALAQSVPGVAGVRNEIVVRPENHH